VQCGVQDVRAHLYNWPPGKHETWPTLQEVDLSDHFDELMPDGPHPLKVFHDGSVISSTRTGSSLVAAVNATFKPLWQKAARFVPGDTQPSTRIMLVAMGDVSSLFHSGVVQLIPIDNA